MKYIKIEYKTFKTISLCAGDTLELTYEDIKVKTINATHRMEISEVLIIITEDYGVIEGMALLRGEYE